MDCAYLLNCKIGILTLTKLVSVFFVVFMNLCLFFLLFNSFILMSFVFLTFTRLLVIVNCFTLFGVLFLLCCWMNLRILMSFGLLIETCNFLLFFNLCIVFLFFMRNFNGLVMSFCLLMFISL